MAFPFVENSENVPNILIDILHSEDKSYDIL